MKDGGPAFPIQADNESSSPCSFGMTLRDWFAGQALVGWFAFHNDLSWKEIAESCYECADAMVNEWAKGGGK